MEITEKNNLFSSGKPKKGYWYKTYISECVFCGAEEKIKIRQYTPKPKEEKDRYVYEQLACKCHFV